MTAANTPTPFDPDDPYHAALLASDPLDWARRATLLVYVRHAAPLAGRADRRAEGRRLHRTQRGRCRARKHSRT